MGYSTILFDVDGTLCDPGPSLIESAWYALARLGIEENDESNLRRFVGPPLEHSFRDYYGLDAATTDKAVGFFREKLVNDGIHLYKPYEGVAGLLAELRQSGKTLGVVTSKIDHIAKPVLDNADLTQYFGAICTQQAHQVVHKEDILQQALAELHVTDTQKAVMIGDRKHDVEAAKVHGVDSIGVLWGYGSADELRSAGATHIVQDVPQLQNLLLSKE
jgi:phosphoglycolate phosphatase